MATQIAPKVVSWTKDNGAHLRLTVDAADAAKPAARTLTVRWGDGFATRDEIADALRSLAVLVTDPPGAALVAENGA